MTRTKRVITLLAALVLTVSLAAPALALDDIDLNAKGTIKTTVADKEYQEDLQGQGAKVGLKIYKVAIVNEHGAFTATSAFKSLEDNPQWKGGIIYNKKDPAQAGNPAYDADAQVKALLDAALEVVQAAEPAEGEEGGITPAFDEKVDAVDGEVDLGEIKDAGVGLYLVVPEHVTTVLWEYDFSAALLAVPSIAREKNEAGELTDPDDGVWVYEVPMFLKAERERHLTDIVIEKSLPEYNATLGETTFLFDVQADIDGKNVFSQLVPLAFSGTGTQKATVSGIPVGAHVTVTEVYSGGSYQVKDGKVTVEIKELPLPADGDYTRVPFTNTYTDRQNPDTSLVNTWVHEGEGWHWQSGEEAG